MRTASKRSENTALSKVVGKAVAAFVVVIRFAKAATIRRDAALSCHQIKPLQGKSLVPVFNNQPLGREAIYWEHEGNRAVRVGDWKLVAKGSMDDRTLPVQWELYDISTDRNENINLIDREPEQASKLKKMWQAYADSSDVFPAPVKKKKPKPKKKEPKPKNKEAQKK